MISKITSNKIFLCKNFLYFVIELLIKNIGQSCVVWLSHNSSVGYMSSTKQVQAIYIIENMLNMKSKNYR